MAQIKRIFFLPPLAVARLGGSDTPVESYQWIEDPTLHGAGQTVLDPMVTLTVQPDGTLRASKPMSIQFRDNSGIRPVAPFLELWAQVDANADLEPLTSTLLAESGAGLDGITFSVTAANRKASRRTGDPACAYQAFLQIAGTDHARHTLLASSTGTRPLVSAARPIPLGTFQVIRPIPNRSDLGVNLDTIRVRLTPAKGEVYGTPSATQAEDQDPSAPSGLFEMVPPQNRLLNADSSWSTYNGDFSQFNNPEPADTYDGADDNTRNDLSFGVVDDTCDLLIQAAVVVNGTRFTAQARVTSGPPDFAPDRRPFVSLADELVDRDPSRNETPEEFQAALDRLTDLFQRIYETASLANVDAMRDRAVGGQAASPFPPATTLPETMTPADPLFDKTGNLNSAASQNERLPYASIAHEVHAPLADAEDLALFLRGNADKVRRLIRPPYGTFSELDAAVPPGAAPNPTHRDPRNARDHQHDMRMPPYMRDSDASPLSLTHRQYSFLMQMLDRVQGPVDLNAVDLNIESVGGAPAEAAPLQTRVRDHVRQVVARRASSPQDGEGGGAPK